MKCFLAILIFFAAILQDSYAQIHVNADPLSFEFADNHQLNIVEFNPLNDIVPKIEKVKQPLYAGYKLLFDKEEISKGIWRLLQNGFGVWQLKIKMDEAKGLNVYFSDFQLDKDEMLFVYNHDRSTVLGAFTEANNGRFLATEFVPGENIIIEFNTPNPSETVPFSIDEIGVSVLSLIDSERDFGDSDDCEILVNCPEGDDWKSERNSVTRILVSEGTSLFWCTGSLMNNTNLDATPYLLTANHCGETSSEADYLKWVFDFNYQSDNCEMPNFEPDHQSMTGASLVAHADGATNTGSDFKLLLLSDDVPDTYAPYFNGWDRSGEGAESGIGIHHPEGDLKMISTYDNPLVSTNYNNETEDDDGKYWKVVWSPTEGGHGVTEGGSSGSPIFSEFGYVVGTLSGGRASCIAQDKADYYGKFSYSWESNGTDSSQQLKPWLDPKNSGLEQLRGSTIDSNMVLANFTVSSSEIRVGQSVAFYNKSEGDIIGYEWFFEGGNPEYSELFTPPIIEYNNVGEFDVMLIAKSYAGNDTLLVKDYIHVLPTLSPNPSTGLFKITFGGEMPDDLDIKVTDMQGRNINFDTWPEGEFIRFINLGLQNSGMYLISIYANGSREVLKASVVRQQN